MARAPQVPRFTLAEDSQVTMARLHEAALKRGQTLTQFVLAARDLAQSLPLELRRFFTEHTTRQSTSRTFVISSVGVGTDTQADLEAPDRNVRPPSSADAALVVLGSLIGQIFAYPSVQRGNLVTDIKPRLESRGKNVGSSADTDFKWHTENAYLGYGGDWIALLCIQNPQREPTRISILDVDLLAEEVRDALQQPNFLVRPNRRIAVPASALRPRPILWGPPHCPNLRVNLNQPMLNDDDIGAKHALAELEKALDTNAVDVTLEPGEALFIDNLKCAHARRAFAARYDATDRWLKRIYIDKSWTLGANALMANEC